MQFDDFDNPYRAPEMLSEPARESIPRATHFWVRLVLILQMLTAVIGTAAAFIDVETIVATGPILSILGIFGVVASLRQKCYLSLAIGVSGPAISVTIFLIIFLQRWNPSDAQRPIPVLAFAYSAAICLLGQAALRQISAIQGSLDSSTDLPSEISPTS